VEQQRRQNRAVAFLLDGFLARRAQQFACLMIAERRGLAFAALGLRALDAFDRVMADRIFVAQIFEQ
jgi:hypothetical protein